MLKSAQIIKNAPIPFAVYTPPAYNLAKLKTSAKRERKLASTNTVSFEHSVAVLRPFSLGINHPISLHAVLNDTAKLPVRSELSLPHPLAPASDNRILVFADISLEKKAKQLGAAIVGDAELIAKFVASPAEIDKLRITKVLATKQMFPQVVKIAKILGPKGIMPSPAKGTVSDDLKELLSNVKATIKYEADQDKVVHMEIAKVMNLCWIDYLLISDRPTGLTIRFWRMCWP